MRKTVDWTGEERAYRTAASTRKPNTERNRMYENHESPLTNDDLVKMETCSTRMDSYAFAARDRARQSPILDVGYMQS